VGQRHRCRVCARPELTWYTVGQSASTRYIRPEPHKPMCPCGKETDLWLCIGKDHGGWWKTIACRAEIETHEVLWRRCVPEPMDDEAEPWVDPPMRPDDRA